MSRNKTGPASLPGSLAALPDAAAMRERLERLDGAPAGWLRMLTEVIHECRERLAADLLGRLRKTERPDGTWPQAEMTQAVKVWLLDHGVNPDAPRSG